MLSNHVLSIVSIFSIIYNGYKSTVIYELRAPFIGSINVSLYSILLEKCLLIRDSDISITFDCMVLRAYDRERIFIFRKEGVLDEVWIDGASAPLSDR
jgi:hypothetical protein